MGSLNGRISAAHAEVIEVIHKRAAEQVNEETIAEMIVATIDELTDTNVGIGVLRDGVVIGRLLMKGLGFVRLPL